MLIVSIGAIALIMKANVALASRIWEVETNAVRDMARVDTRAFWGSEDVQRFPVAVLSGVRPESGCSIWNGEREYG